MLSFLSKIYSYVIFLRNFLYDHGFLFIYKSKLPIICVGNATAGGNGKTPLVIHLVKELKKKGKSPVVLSRGYGGSLSGPYQIRKEDSSELVGDEPIEILNSAKVPVVISKDRALGAKLIERQEIGDIIILDDGLQHRRLARDFNILSFDISSKKSIDTILDQKLLPKGRYREPLKSALKRSDIVILNKRGSNQESKELDVLFHEHKVIRTNLQCEGVKNICSGQDLIKGDVIALSAIANPQGFYASLESMGYKILKKYSFKDHYKFTKEDLDKICRENKETPIVCTKKDSVKLSQLDIDLSNVYILSVSLKDTDIVEQLPI